MAFRLTPLSVLVQTEPAKAKAQLVAALKAEHGDIKATAKRLDVSRQCVYNWIERLAINVSRAR